MSTTSPTVRARTGFRPAYFLGRPSAAYTARYAPLAPVTTLRPAITDRAA
jgi:hypothetical protein